MYNFVPMYHLAFKQLEKETLLYSSMVNIKRIWRRYKRRCIIISIYLFVTIRDDRFFFFFFFQLSYYCRSIRSKEKKKNVIVLSKIKSFIICAIFKKHIISKYLSKTYNKYLHVCTRDGIYCRLIIDYLWFRKQHLETLVSTF